jgi:CRP-like cAMP-binding protein
MIELAHPWRTPRSPPLAPISLPIWQVYLEGDFVIHHGDVNSAMYFITRGECAVLIPEPGRSSVLRKIKTISREAYFGELSLLDEHAVASACVPCR